MYIYMCIPFHFPAVYRKPIAHLFGQGAPVFSLCINSEEDRIYSIGNDNSVKVRGTVHSCITHVSKNIYL